MNNSGFKSVFVGLFILILMFSVIGSVFAITGSIKNARMIIRVDQGDDINRYIQVNNVNDVSIEVELFASGDLEDYVEIKDDKFELQPGDSKKAYFTLEAKKAGTTETKINVKFAPVGGGNGVGLSSTVIVIAEDKGLFGGLFGDDDDDSSGSDDTSSDDSDDKTESGSSKGLMAFAGTSTIILAIIFIILVVFASKKRNDSVKKKKSDKTKPKKGGEKDE
jgi:hypothetical protein